jgi:CHAT domain-containing protein
LQPTAAALKTQAAAADLRADELRTWPQRAQATDALADAALVDAARAVRALALEPVAWVGQPEPDVSSAAILPKGQARATYWIRTGTVEVVLQVGAKRHHLQLPHTALEVNRSVNALRAELARPGVDVPPMAQQLYRWLVAPLMPYLPGVQHLHVAPDGALRYVPFAALHSGKEFLAQRYSISLELGAMGLAEDAQAPGRVPTKAPRLAAFGRTKPDERHAALPGVRRELAVLAGLRGAVVRPALDAQFTQETLLLALRGRPDVVHLASHFVLDAAGEEASYLLLGDGNRMPLRQLRELPWAGVNLALLSACDSGLALDAPGSSAQGRELAGFAATLHAAGVRNVMATLWRIDDASTAQWMQAFYAPWQQAGRAGPLDARHLARVQRAWLQRHAGTALAHPFHWAAFSWMGDPS